ncbi:MAG: hypothetical protein ACE5HH_00950 [Candidatus Hydrothermarchaeales archaeon]
MALLTNILGVLILLVTAVGAYFANELKSALAGSELAVVWKYIGIGVVLLFLSAIAGGAARIVAPGQELAVVLLFMLLASACLTYGLKLQLDKVK